MQKYIPQQLTKHHIYCSKCNKIHKDTYLCNISNVVIEKKKPIENMKKFYDKISKQSERAKIIMNKMRNNSKEWDY
jgi:hypothetical protein